MRGKAGGEDERERGRRNRKRGKGCLQISDLARFLFSRVSWGCLYKYMMVFPMLLSLSRSLKLSSSISNW